MQSPPAPAGDGSFKYGICYANWMRYLRLFATGTVSLLVLFTAVCWARSYKHFDQANGTLIGQGVNLMSAQGAWRVSTKPTARPKRWSVGSQTIEPGHWVGLALSLPDSFRVQLWSEFGLSVTSQRMVLWMRYWIPMLLLTSLLTLLRKNPFNFGLRFLFVASAFTVALLSIDAFLRN